MGGGPGRRAAARRLTRSAKGEGGAAFLPDGSLLFISARPDPDADEDDDEVGAALAAARRRRRGPRGGARAPAASTASRSPPTPAPSSSPPDLPVLDRRGRRGRERKERKEKKVAAILHESVPGAVLGPRPRSRRAAAVRRRRWPRRRRRRPAHRAARPDPGRRPGAGRGGSTTSAPTARRSSRPGRVAERGGQRSALALVDVATGERRVAARRRRDTSTTRPRSAPTASSVAVVREKRSTPHDPGDRRTRASSPSPTATAARPHRRLGPLAGRPAGGRPTAGAGARRRRGRPRAGVPGRRRERRVHPADQRRRRLHRRAGRARRATVYALRTSYAAPARPVRLDATTADQDPRRCAARRDARAARHARRGRGHRRGRHAGARRGWCCPRAPRAENPAPLLLWIHGGPLGVVERLVLALEPVDRRGAGVRRAAARPGAVHRLRPGVHPARLGRLGRRRRTPT